MMDILMPETCWVHKKWNKIASDIKLVFYSSKGHSLSDCDSFKFIIRNLFHILCSRLPLWLTGRARTRCLPALQLMCVSCVKCKRRLTYLRYNSASRCPGEWGSVGRKTPNFVLPWCVFLSLHSYFIFVTSFFLIMSGIRSSERISNPEASFSTFLSCAVNCMKVLLAAELYILPDVYDEVYFEEYSGTWSDF